MEKPGRERGGGGGGGEGELLSKSAEHESSQSLCPPLSFLTPWNSCPEPPKRPAALLPQLQPSLTPFPLTLWPPALPNYRFPCSCLGTYCSGCTPCSSQSRCRLLAALASWSFSLVGCPDSLSLSSSGAADEPSFHVRGSRRPSPGQSYLRGITMFH